jgi:recombination protein RecA
MTAKLDPKVKKALDAINKKNNIEGDLPAARQLSDHPDINVETTPTGSISLDYIFGCGGFPKGRIVEIHGQPSSGKTTLSLHFASQVQKAGGIVAWVDAEACYDHRHAENIGVSRDGFIYVETNSGENLLDSIDKLAEAGVDLIVVDSVAALVPQAELDGDIGANGIALQARMLSQALRKLTAVVHKSNSTILFINQLRDNINAFGYGPKTTTPGGKSIPFYASVRIEVARIKTIKDKDAKSIGNVIKMKAVKNKVGVPFREILLNFYYESGFDFMAEFITLGLDQEVLSKQGNTIYYGEEKLGGNMQKAIAFLEENGKTTEKIGKDIENKLYKREATEKPKDRTDKVQAKSSS